MKNIYLKIKLDESNNPQISNFLYHFLETFISKILPKANPDFENQIQNINIWLIEFDEDGIPEREIGLDKDGKTVMIMPWKDNYGYWTDNDFKLQDFENGFNCSEIEKDYFEKEWIEFDQNNL